MESPHYLESVWTLVGDVSAQKRDTNPNQTKETKPSVDE